MATDLLLLDPNVVLLLLNVALFCLFYADAQTGGHGAFAVGGAIGYLLAGLLLFDAPGALAWAAGPVTISPWLLAPIAAALAAYCAVLVRAVLGARRLAPFAVGMPRAGLSAVAVTELAPRGVVRVCDEEWSAETAAEPVPIGEKVEVVAREGLRLLVRRVAPAVAAPVVAGMLGDPLTRREREVAALIARGLTNRQIAAELVIAETTADRHVSNILGKLDFATRSQVAVWAADRGIPTQNAPL